MTDEPDWARDEAPDWARDPGEEHARNRAESGAGFGSSVVHGMPIIGALAEKGAAAANAAVDGLRGDALPFSQRYERNLQMAREADANYRSGEARPGDLPLQGLGRTASSVLGNVAGSAAALGPVAATGIGARVLGAGAGSLLGRTAASTASGAAMGAGDAALRGEDVGGGAATGALGGAVAPAVGHAVGSAVNRVTGITKASVAPTAQEGFRAADAGYDAARAMPVKIDARGPEQLSHQIEQRDLGGFSRDSAPQTFAVLDKLRVVSPGSHASVEKILDTKKAFSNILGDHTMGETDKKAAGIALNKYLDYLDNIPAHHVISGDVQALRQTLQPANDAWAAAERTKTFGGQITKAERAAGRPDTGKDLSDFLHQKTTAMLNSPRLSRGYNPEELAKAEEIVRGTPTRKIAEGVERTVGGTGLFGKSKRALVASALGHAAGLGPLGDALAATVPSGIAAVARKVGGNEITRGVRELDDMIRMRSPLAANARFARSRGAYNQDRMQGPQNAARGTVAAAFNRRDEDE